ncbi:hypothetical protein C6P41_000211 [Kluyveromyces marxianus]|nr:hypothetical protein C6P43_003611 [Kluyveromyces marxianus]KAG0680389.1 hypothetical protein C6P41_000211 [Kluyveromyces marxianus]
MSWCQENVSDVYSLGYGYGYAYGNGYGYGYGYEQEQGSGSQAEAEAEFGGEKVEPGVVLETEFSYTTLGGLDFGLGDEEVGSSGGSSGVSGSSFSEPSPAPIPRQRRYSKPQQTTPPPSEGSMTSSSTSSSPGSGAKKVSDSRLSARGLAQVLNLDSPAEALCREKFILDIFEKELHYPLGYKTWVRGTTKEYRAKILYQLHERVKVKYPEYDEKVLETIIRRATYYMMQSRLRRERRAKAKANKQQQQRGKASSKTKAVVAQESYSEPESVPDVTAVSNSDLFIAGEAFLSGDSFLM